MIKEVERFDIFSVQLKDLEAISGEINASFISELTSALPTFIKEHKKYWLINTNLTVSAPQQQLNIKVINVLLQYARGKCNVLQIIKPRSNATKQKQKEA